MSLTSALNIAQSALLNTSRQTSVVSRNVADARNANYTHRTATVVSMAPGARTIDIQRATNELLFRQNLQALSAWSGQSALYNGMTRLDLAVNGVDNASSASAAIGELQKALQLYSTSPSNQNLGAGVVNAARQAVRSLNDGSQAIQDFRTQTDGEIAAAVDDLNALLARFEEVNQTIVSGTRSGTDVSDALDQRDALLKKIAEYLPISSFTRPGNDMVVTTTDGTMLFETMPRTVSFAPSPGYAAGVPGSRIYVDNVPVIGGVGGDTTASGRLAGLVQLRDGVAETMQRQLDEIARGLITAFAETAPPAPALTGLFTWSGGPAIPADGTLEHGIAGTIKVNPKMDPSAPGGDINLLRDGRANDPIYIVNPGSGSSFADLLIAYSDRLDKPMQFDPAAGIALTLSVTGYSANAIGWFQGMRQQASAASEAKEALATRTAEALSNETGVNVDSELSLLLDLEHTYQASARILSTVDQMMDQLFRAVG
jgi:flagellar hook-associated protein 1 FlgK